ncbi:MAG: hypothetical protein OHK0046_34930 [Anaerolineae bacterium]
MKATLRLIPLILLLIGLAACDSASTTTDSGGSTGGAQTAPTITPLPPTASPTFDAAAQTLVAGATQTAVIIATNPAAAPTLVEAQLLGGSCSGGVSSVFDAQRSQRIQTALDNANIKDTTAGVIETQDSTDCNNIRVTNSLFTFSITVGTLNDDAFVGDTLANILAVVEGLPDQTIPGETPATMTFTFTSSNTNAERVFANVPYDRVMTAYSNGARSAALIQQLNQ